MADSAYQSWCKKVALWRIGKEQDRPSLAALIIQYDMYPETRRAKKMLYKREVHFRYLKGIAAPNDGR